MNESVFLQLRSPLPLKNNPKNNYSFSEAIGISLTPWINEDINRVNIFMNVTFQHVRVLL